MEKPEVIKKDVSKLKISPNLKDYDAVRKTFSWDFVEKEIEFFDDGKINAAYNAVDRHLNSDVKDKIAFHWLGEDETKDAIDRRGLT